MRRPRYLLALVVVAVTTTVAQGAALVSLGRARLPVYYGTTTAQGYFEIEIAQKSYGEARPTTPYDGFRANIAIEKNKESVTAEEVVIRYVEHVLKGDYESIPLLYAPGTDSAAAKASARAFRDDIQGLSEIGFRSEWFYKDAKFLLVDLRLEGDISRVMGFGFRNTPQGFLLSLGGSDDEEMMLGLFDYLSETTVRGRVKDYAFRRYDLSVPIGRGLFGVVLNVDGPQYDKQQGWRLPAQAAAPGSPRAFVESVLARAAALEDEAFVRLWCAEDAVDAASLSADALARLKQGHAASGRIKHVLTMAFGEAFAHYFVEESDPGGVRSIFVGKAGDGFCLSRGPDDRRVRALLQSEVLKDGVWDLWAAPGGS